MSGSREVGLVIQVLAKCWRRFRSRHSDIPSEEPVLSACGWTLQIERWPDRIRTTNFRPGGAESSPVEGPPVALMADSPERRLTRHLVTVGFHCVQSPSHIGLLG